MQSPHDLIGRALQGRYVVTELLGEGAMGIVYRGLDEEALRDVAIKVLQPQLAAHPELVARFYREGAAARQVDHESAVRFLGKGQDGDIHFLVMELIDGRSLGDLLAVEIRLPQVRAARLMMQLGGALAVAHERGIVHRDLKPENVMICGRPGEGLGEQAKLLDFGIAKRFAEGPPRLPGIEDSFGMDALTSCGSLIGTPEYMAPEQCRGHAVDARTDVYACGVLLYRLITGRTPFWAEHPLEICQMHLSDPPSRPSAHVPGLDPALEAVILKAMSKDPAARQPNAAELRAELQAVIDRLALAETEPTGMVPRSALAPSGVAKTLAMDLEAPPPPEPRTRIQTRGRRRCRERLPAVAVYVALGAGAASILFTLSALLHR